MATTDPRERLLELAGERSVSLAQLSALIGRNASYLQQFVRKGSPRKLEEGDRATLARFFGVGEGELGASEEKSFGDDWVDVPRLALGASAGPGALAPDEQAIGAFRFGRAWLRRQGLDPRHLSAIAVDGDSMEPGLRDGDEILVDATPRPLRDGVHVVRVDGALLVKRMETGRPGLIVLKSDNPAYDPIELNPADVEVVGRVVWKGGRL
ncbi:MAG: LexA family transcriptional regulator [Sphingomonadales bacterium]|nr:LexA family transcriptional regulator [Sphingomonadales bacterium]